MSVTTQCVVDAAKRAARTEASDALLTRHFVIAVLADDGARAALGRQLLDGAEVAVPPALAETVARTAAAPEVTDKIPLGPGIKEPFQRLYRLHDGMPPLEVLLSMLLQLQDEAVEAVLAANPSLELEGPDDPRRPHSNLGRLMEEINALQNTLSSRVIGQNQAIQQIADAVFQAKIYGRQNTDTPRAVLLFLGPPGVGKTYTAQLIAEAMGGEDEQSFLQLDMSGYADRESYRMLIGFEPSYQGARPGLLTAHVKEHPNSVILVDEVEKANRTVHNLFLQILDRGMLEDKNTQENVSFGGTVLIITTNLGKDLYQSPNQSGFLSQFPISRPAVFEAMSNARDPQTGLVALTPELCSRLAKGYPILFNHLTPVDLEEIARLAVGELALEFEGQLGLHVTPPDDRLLTLMVLRLGPDLDARALTSGIPLMVKDAFREVLTQHRDELFREADTFDRVRTLAMVLPEGPEREFFQRLHEGGRRVMMITDRSLEETVTGRFGEFDWCFATDGRAALEALRHKPVDFVLLDLDLGEDEGLAGATCATRELRRIRAAHPDLAVYLYCDRDVSAHPDPAFTGRIVDSGGARGFLAGPIANWQVGESSPLENIRRILLRECYLREMFRTRQTVHFDWSIEIGFDEDGKEGVITLSPNDIHPQTVVASKDRTARLSFTGIPAERFENVAGAREAKRRLKEIIGWMRNPESLRALGIDLPAGIMLEGPPGNGKTLLARATAGEANLPFFAVAATDFASKWVGQSEENIRELFERAATYAPSILFIDEIDAIGAARSAAHSSGVGDSMLNQLLVCMDGFTSRDRPVFFLAATNRADLLDPALKRPGRFDLVITIEDLDVEARRELLGIASRDLPLAADVDLDGIARASMGMSGAQLAQVIKEAAILTLREQDPGDSAAEIEVRMEHLREALTNVRHGLRREGPAPAEEEIRRTAYHEAGHALISELERPGSVHQATVLPRGRALGFVESLPTSEYESLTAADVRSRIRVALAGRGAELQVFGCDEVSAGCSQDLEMATQLAALAVTRFGMSSTLGPVSFRILEQLIPGSGAADRARMEVEKILREEEGRVAAMLEERREALEQITELLVTTETAAGSEIAALAAPSGPGTVLPSPGETRTTS